MRFSSLLVVAAAGLVLTGCSTEEMFETMLSLSGDAAQDNAKGVYSYTQAESYAEQKQFEMAQYLYCNAAKLGYDPAKAKCSDFTVYIAGTMAEEVKPENIHSMAKQVSTYACEAAVYGEAAQKLCWAVQNAENDEAVLKAARDAKDVNSLTVQVYAKMQEMSAKSEPLTAEACGRRATFLKDGVSHVDSAQLERCLKSL